MDVTSVGAVQAGALPDPQPAAAQPPAGATHDEPAKGLQQRDSALLSDVVKIMGQGSSHLHVSYRVTHDPSIIVTVFTDPQTGQEVAQFPPEVMVQLAQFFDKESGVTLDSSV